MLSRDHPFGPDGNWLDTRTTEPTPASRSISLPGTSEPFLCSLRRLWNLDSEMEVDPSRNMAHLSAPEETYCHRVQRWAFTRPLSVPGRCSLMINISFPCKTNSYTSFLPRALLSTVTQRVVCDVEVERRREKWLVENNHNSARHRKNLTAAVRVPRWEVLWQGVCAFLRPDG